MNPSEFANFTPRAKETLWLAREEALRLHDEYVGTAYILLGIIRLGQGVAVNVLVRLGLNLENVWAEVERQIGVPLEEKESTDYPHVLKAKLKHFISFIHMGAVWPPDSAREQMLTEPQDKWLTNTQFTPGTERVFRLAKEEAEALSHPYIGTEHLLLGLIRDSDGLPARVLNKFCVDIEQGRKGVLKESDPNFDESQKG